MLLFIWFILCSIFNFLVVGFMFLSLLAFIGDWGGYFFMVASLVPAALGFFASSVWAAIQVRLKKLSKMRIVCIDVLFKATVGFICIGVVYLTPPFEHQYKEACIFFVVLGIVMGIFLMSAIFRKKEKKFENKTHFPGYIARNYWKDAIAEYKRIYLSSELETMPDRLDIYSSMPIIYMIQWLMEMGALIGASDPNPIREFKKRSYVLKRDDVREDMRGFLDWYVWGNGFSGCNLWNELFEIDYCRAIMNDKGAYYCVEYDFLTYDRLKEVIDKRFLEWNDANTDDQLELEKTIEWRIFGKELEVYANNWRVGAEYIDRCEVMLNRISMDAIKNLEREISFAYYKNVDFLADYIPIDVHIFASTDGSECGIVVNGECSFEGEHGISLMIRNGYIVRWGEAYDYENPFSKDMEMSYELLKESFENPVLTEKIIGGELVRLSPMQLKYYEMCMEKIKVLEYIYGHMSKKTEFEFIDKGEGIVKGIRVIANGMMGLNFYQLIAV